MNIYESLVQICPSIHMYLKLYGENAARIRSTASDYERFSELCRLMPKMCGNPFYREINVAAQGMLGRTLCEGRVENHWRSFNGDTVTEYACDAPALNLCVYNSLEADVMISGVSEFIKPNPYSVENLRACAARGEIDEIGKCVLQIQTVREVAQACVKSGRPMKLRASKTELSVICQILEYLESSGLLPSTLVCVDCADLSQPELADRLYASRMVRLCLCAENEFDLSAGLGRLSECMPIGCACFMLPKSRMEGFVSLLQTLSHTWCARGLAPKGLEIAIKDF